MPCLRCFQDEIQGDLNIWMMNTMSFCKKLKDSEVRDLLDSNFHLDFSDQEGFFYSTPELSKDNLCVVIDLAGHMEKGIGLYIDSITAYLDDDEVILTDYQEEMIKEWVYDC